MKKKPKIILCILIVCCILATMTGCDRETSASIVQPSLKQNTDSPLPDFKVTENKGVYKDENTNVQDIYITIPEYTGKWTFNDINNYKFNREQINQVKPTVEVRFDTGKQPGGTVGIMANATMEPRGHGASMAAQKSYRITLFDNAGLWNGQKVINLNKHPNDLTRIRNMLSYHYINQLPQLFGFKMQFTHLYVRDLNSTNKGFVDYGLFTHVEQPNKQYLKSHGIAQSAYMYKAEYFEFFRDEDKIKNVSDTGYDKKAFESELSIKGIEDHTRLISMLNDVNNEDMNINDIISKDFDRDNYITWLAVNILMGNHDTNSQNFILVSPVTSTKWYFIPWDYDSAWGYETQTGTSPNEYASWEREGISNYWGVVLHRRFFKEPGNLKELSSKIDELASMMTKEKTDGLVKEYYSVTNKYVKSTPDLKFLPAGIADYEKEIEKLPGLVEENRKKFYDNIQKPMPIYLGDPVKNGNICTFNWDESYDFQGDDLFYDFQVSTNPEFTNIVADKKGIKETKTTVDALGKGKYYWKVEVHDSKGNRQAAFDYYKAPNGDKYNGIREFTIN